MTDMKDNLVEKVIRCKYKKNWNNCYL
jgi:hypothetical protein